MVRTQVTGTEISEKSVKTDFLPKPPHQNDWYDKDI
jgi:hypothetical protein